MVLSSPPELLNRGISPLRPEKGLALGAEEAGSFTPHTAPLLPCPTMEAEWLWLGHGKNPENP